MKNLLGRATVIAIATMALAACGGSGGADEYAADYPSKDIKMIITYTAGGPTDLAGRAIAKYIESETGVSVIVENVDGASGALGTAKIAQSAPDGYTIGMTTGSAAARVPLMQDVGYSLDDLTPIGMGTLSPGLVVVPADSPYETAEQLFAEAEKNPGSISFGTAGVSTPQGVELERMKSEYGIEFKIVPFEGEAPLVTALLGKNVDVGFASNSDVTMTQVEAGKLRVIGHGSTDELDYLPDSVPISSLGYDKLVWGNSTYVLVGPAGLDPEVLSTLEGLLKGALDDPATRKVIGENRIPPEFVGSADLLEMMQQEQEELGPILDELFGEG